MATDIEALIREEVNKSRHRTLTDAELGDRRVFVIGDIHGCYQELRELLRIAAVDVQNDIIISVGDVLNKVGKPCFVLAIKKACMAVWNICAQAAKYVGSMCACSCFVCGVFNSSDGANSILQPS